MPTKVTAITAGNTAAITRIKAVSFKTMTGATAIGFCVVAIVYFGLITDAALPDHPAVRGMNDLVLHALAFAALSVPCFALFGVRTGSGIVWAAIFLVEALQMMQPERQASLEDVVSGGAGWLAVLIVWLILRKRV